MRYKDVQCVCCGNKFTDSDDVAVCPECGSPHHKSCYNENGRCFNSEKHKDGFVWEFPEELKPKITIKKRHQGPEVLDYKFKNGESAVICPYCKTPNYGNDALCIKCRKPLMTEEESKKSAKNFKDDDERVSYYNRFGGLKPDILIEGVPAEDISEYIKFNSGSYVRKFVGMERFGRKFSVSVAAFFFGPVWFLYRKMYKYGLLYLLILLLLAGIEGFCTYTPYYLTTAEGMSSYISETFIELSDSLKDGEFSAEDKEKLSKRLEDFRNMEFTEEVNEYTASDEIRYYVANIASLTSYVLRFVAAFFGDMLYKKKVIGDIKSMRRKTDNSGVYHKLISKKGGISVIGLLLALIGTYAIKLLSSLPFTITAISDFFLTK